jgi:UDP-glucuronate 4-epimerase
LAGALGRVARDFLGSWNFIFSLAIIPFDLGTVEGGMTYLVTGAAGFIGYHLCERLLLRHERVIAVDSLNAYYSPQLKKARLERLIGRDGFEFHEFDIANTESMLNLARIRPGITHIAHLAAQAGVRHSLSHPRDYVSANLNGFLEILELARNLPALRHLVYASSSSVYGANTKLPFSVDDRVDRPVSLYAASKKANEMMAYSYSHLYNIPATGLRFFTVYGPWGRPDMAAFIFTRAILAGEPISVFNNGDMRRDFTYVDDIVSGVVACLDQPPVNQIGKGAPHRVYNLGNSRSENLMDFIAILEDACERKALVRFEPIQPGDVKDTYADIAAAKRDLGFNPGTPIRIGLPKFVSWYRTHYKDGNCE